MKDAKEIASKVVDLRKENRLDEAETILRDAIRSDDGLGNSGINWDMFL